MRTIIVYFQEKLLSRPNTNNDYITLKEAAELSGYSSDYVGQLIRAGKLHGKQVYSNVAWVTTEDALQRYMYDQENPVLGTGKVAEYSSRLNWWWRRATLDGDRFLMISLWMAVTVLSIIALVLLYIGSVTLDRFLTHNALERYEQERTIDPSFFETVPFRLEGPPDR